MATDNKVFHSFEDAFGSKEKELAVEKRTEHNKKSASNDKGKAKEPFNRKEAKHFLKRLNNSQLTFFDDCSVNTIKLKLSQNKNWYIFGDNEISRADLNMVLKCKIEAPDLIKNAKKSNKLTKSQKERTKAKKHEKYINSRKVSSNKQSNTNIKKNINKNLFIPPVRDVNADKVGLYCERYSEMSDKQVISELKRFVQKHDIATLKLLETKTTDEYRELIIKGNSNIKDVSLIDLGLLLTCRNRRITSKLINLKERIEAEKGSLKQTIIKEPKPDTDYSYQDEGIAFEDFVIKGNKRRCVFDHESIMIKAAISLINRRGTVLQKIIPAGYCPKCKSFFILQRDFDEISDYGVPLCQQFTEEEFRLYIKYGQRAFKTHSLINQMGYNVNAKDDLSTTQRHAILALALDRKVYTRSQLDHHIYVQSAMRANNPSMENAIAKWEEDRKFVQNYKAGSTPVIGVKSIKKKLK